MFSRRPFDILASNKHQHRCSEAAKQIPKATSPNREKKLLLHTMKIDTTHSPSFEGEKVLHPHDSPTRTTHLEARSLESTWCAVRASDLCGSHQRQACPRSTPGLPEQRHSKNSSCGASEVSSPDHRHYVRRGIISQETQTRASLPRALRMCKHDAFAM